MTRLPAGPVWIALLVLSVLVNGILIGVLLQRAAQPQLQPSAHHREALQPGRFNPRAFLAALPEEAQEDARGRLRDGWRDMRPLMRQVRETRREAADRLAADPFDPQRAAEALADARAARTVMEARSEAIVLDIVQDLDAGTRREVLAAAWSGRPPFGARHRRPG